MSKKRKQTGFCFDLKGRQDIAESRRQVRKFDVEQFKKRTK